MFLSTLFRHPHRQVSVSPMTYCFFCAPQRCALDLQSPPVIAVVTVTNNGIHILADFPLLFLSVCAIGKLHKAGFCGDEANRHALGMPPIGIQRGMIPHLSLAQQQRLEFPHGVPHGVLVSRGTMGGLRGEALRS